MSRATSAHILGPSRCNLQDRPSRLRKTLVECRTSDYAILRKGRGSAESGGKF